MTDRKLRIMTVSAHPHDFTWYSATLGINLVFPISKSVGV